MSCFQFANNKIKDSISESHAYIYKLYDSVKINKEKPPLFLKYIFIVENIICHLVFPIDPLHPTPTASQAFTTLLPVSLGYANIHINSLVNLFLWEGHSCPSTHP